MSEINTKIFKPQKWVLDVLNSPKGETIEFEIEGATESFIKISDKVPENIDGGLHLYSSNEDEVYFTGAPFFEIDPSVYAAMDAFIIFTNDIEGISKGTYLLEEVYEQFKEMGGTELYLIFQTNQDFSISKKTIEGEVHPIEEKYIPNSGGGSSRFEIEMEVFDRGSRSNEKIVHLITSTEDIANALDNGNDIVIKVYKGLEPDRNGDVDYYYPNCVSIASNSVNISCTYTFYYNNYMDNETIHINVGWNSQCFYYANYKEIVSGFHGDDSSCIEE